MVFELSMNDRTDEQTTVSELRQLMAQFVAERDWGQFHSPKNLAMSMAIEASELMEHFQWLTNEQSEEIDAAVRHEVGEELADVVCYAMSLANSLDIDIASAVFQKMEKNRLKYPVDKFRGRYGDSDPSTCLLYTSPSPRD